MKHLKIAFILTVCLTACRTDDKIQQQAQVLYKESMDIHDAVMPRMDELFTLRQKLTLKLDSLKIDSVTHAGEIEQIRKAIADLAAADKGMMDWMHNIQDVPGEETNHAHHGSENETAEHPAWDEVLKLQQQQKEAVEKVKKAIETSLAAGKKLLDH